MANPFRDMSVIMQALVAAAVAVVLVLVGVYVPGSRIACDCREVVQAVDPYFNILDFFGRLGRLSRIINVGDLTFDDPEKSKGTKYATRPGTTVSGIFTATTFFTKPADTGAVPVAGAKPAAGAAGKP